MLETMNNSLNDRLSDMNNQDFITLYELIFRAHEHRKEQETKNNIDIKKIKADIIKTLITQDYEINNLDLLKEI